MSKILDEVLKANKEYSSNFGDRGKLALPFSAQPAITGVCLPLRTS